MYTDKQIYMYVHKRDVTYATIPLNIERTWWLANSKILKYKNINEMEKQNKNSIYFQEAIELKR